MKTVVLDNGSACIKLIQVSESETDRFSTAPNCVARSKDDRKLFIGPELWPRLQQQPQTMQFKRAHDRGYLTSWETERLIWDELFRTTGVDDALAANVLLILSEPPDNLSTLQEMTDHMVFDYFRFDAFVRCPTALLASYGAASALGDLQGRQREFCLVVDVGFSHTHITPIIDGQVATMHVKRLDIGGKFLTNVLKESISFRHYNMMEETLLVEHIKEACCFVSMEFEKDMERARDGTLKTQYLLPDVATNTPGRLVEAEDIAALSEDAQLLPLTSETFTIPELLFTPSDMSHTQGGVVDGIVQAIETLPRHIQGLLLANIIVLGNSSRFKNFEARLERDLQS
ncbi:actin family, partial [Protomyces lactucae-debilis]